MAETDLSIATRVQAHLRAAGAQAPALPDIVPLLATARETLARMVAADPARRRELRPAAPFEVVVAAGEGDLSTLLAEPSRLLLDSLTYADVRDAATGARLFFVSRTAYDLQQPGPYGYFTFEGQTILARLTGEAAGASNFTAEISGNYVPTSAEVPPSCVGDLVLIVARMIMPPPKKERRNAEG